MSRELVVGKNGGRDARGPRGAQRSCGCFVPESGETRHTSLREAMGAGGDFALARTVRTFLLRFVFDFFVGMFELFPFHSLVVADRCEKDK